MEEGPCCPTHSQREGIHVGHLHEGGEAVGTQERAAEAAVGGRPARRIIRVASSLGLLGSMGSIGSMGMFMYFRGAICERAHVRVHG
jgi:hypothetical protein